MTARALAVRVVLVVAAYVATARLGLVLGAASGFATLVWPPTAIAMAAVLVYGYRLWPAVAAGALLVNLWMGAPVPVALGIAIGNVLEAVVAVYCLRRVDFHHALDRLRDVVALTGLAAIASTTISATIGVTSLWFGGRIPPGDLDLTWVTWWWGDLSGVVIILPLLLTWSTHAPPSAIDKPTRLEAIAVAAAIVAVGAVLFIGDVPTVVQQPYLIGPLLLWVGVRFGPRGASTASVAIAAMAMIGVVLGHGPFTGATIQARLLDLQPFAMASTLMGLAVGAIAVGRVRDALAARRSEMQTAAAVVELEHARAELEENVERRTAELRQALCDKDVLLREIHHRVKNNLQVVASLLALQSSVSRPEARPAFDESRQRIRSMSLVHELLYRSSELASIDFGEYLRRVVASVASSYGATGNIELHVIAPEVRLDIDAAVPCGLIVNELVSNSLKHAFPNRRGRIVVSVTIDRGDLVLEVADNGIGLPDVQINNARTLGLQIVHALTNQLHGAVTVTRLHGTQFRIRFPELASLRAAA